MRTALLLRLSVALALAAGLAGCVGYLSPHMVGDGKNLYLVLAQYPLDEDGEPSTIIFVNRTGDAKAWQRTADRSGAARAAAAWRGELWLFFPTACCALRQDKDDFASRIVPLDRDWEVQAAAVHEGSLWVFGVSEKNTSQLATARMLPDKSEWEAAPGDLLLTGTPTRMRAASCGKTLWLLWRKRGADGQVSGEVSSAFYRDGVWKMGPTCDLEKREFAVAPAPSGAGVLVATSRRPGPRWLPSDSELQLYHLGEAGWSELSPTGATAREFAASLINPGLMVRQASGDGAAEIAGHELIVLTGRPGELSVIRSQPDPSGAPGTWSEPTRLPVDSVAPEIAFIPGVFIAAMLVGAGLGMIVVRRRRTYPLPPHHPHPAGILPRAGAWLTDNLLIGIIFYAVAAACGVTAGGLLRDDRLLAIVLGTNRLLFVFYTWTFESRWGATPGKLLFGLRLADDSGHRPSGRAALVRNLLRLVDELFIIPLPGLLFVAGSRLSRRLGDMIAGTVVTTSESLDEVHEDRRRKSDRYGLPR